MPTELLGQYDRWMQSADHSPRTIKQRLRMASWVLERWPDPGQATAADILDWLGSMRKKDGQPLARWTKATYHGHVRAFFSWLANADHIHSDPMTSKLVKRPKTHDGVPRYLSPAQVDRALDAATGNVRAWLLLALRAGLRASEIAAFRGEGIAEDYIILTGKGDREAAIPTHPDLWDLAQTYPRRGWWFPSPEHDGHVAGNSVTVLVGRHFRRPEVDIPKGSIHRCRHTYATNLLRDGANTLEVQQLMRHNSPATTAIYAKVGEDKLRAAINRLGPHPAA